MKTGDEDLRGRVFEYLKEGWGTVDSIYAKINCMMGTVYPLNFKHSSLNIVTLGIVFRIFYLFGVRMVAVW